MNYNVEWTASDTTAIRPFHFSAPEAELTELRRRISATRWPDRETASDDSQGVQLVTIQELARVLGDRVQLAQGGGATKRPNAIRDRNRRAGHSFYSRSFET